MDQAEMLEKELDAFEQMRPELLAHHLGKFALFKGGALVGTFTTESEAYEEGVRQFGTDLFLVRPVLADQPVAAMPALFAGLVHVAP